jgi:trigger factor
VKVEYNEETSVRKSLSFEIEPEVVDREIEERARHYARRAKLPGFRPGKIPPDVIKRRFRQQVLEDVTEKIVNKVVLEELEGRGLKPLAVPKVTELKIEENQPLTFKAVFETLPLIELPEYKGLPARSRSAEVTDEAVEGEIERLREEAARYDPVEGRPAQRGDFVLLDVAWKAEGGGRPGRDDNAFVEVGGAENHEGLNAALEGMSPGETKEVRLVYPADHPSSGLAGKTVDYTVAMKAVKQKMVPAADDEFAKDLGEFGSLQELKDDVRRRLLAAEQRKIDREVKDALLQELVQRASFEVPEALVERHMNARTEGAARGLLFQGVDPTKAGVDWKSYRESQREESVKAAKADILVDEIARREGIEAADAEVDAEIARYAERVKKSRESVRKQMEKEGDLAALRARIREGKVLDLMRANARLTDE